jgi:hypothetical protein
MKTLKENIRSTFNLSNNQVNLLLLSTGTSLFQGFIYYMINKDRFTLKYFIFTVIMSFIYYIFYYKTYINDKIKK